MPTNWRILLTDKRLSRISKFMAETLFDENISGPYGNTHIALGRAYQDSYIGNPAKVTKSQWAKWGFNDSVVHTDIISTTRRTVTAYFSNNSSKVITKMGSSLSNQLLNLGFPNICPFICSNFWIANFTPAFLIVFVPLPPLRKTPSNSV